MRRPRWRLLLSVAYASSIGGVATIIGSPPNGIAARFITQTYGTEVTFLDWMAFGLPFTIVFLPVAWLILTKLLFPVAFREVPGGREMIVAELAKLGPMNRGEKVTLAVFACTAFLWIFGGFLRPLEIGGPPPFRGLTDSGAAMLAALALFLLPADREKGTRAMDWETASRLPWGVLVLFGGGLSLCGRGGGEQRLGLHRAIRPRARRAAAAGRLFPSFSEVSKNSIIGGES